ncbi:hypothetical protein C0J52_09201 [Blattella germanica]|nr:hypothetical protein C0J52_09201 [Blattella germanica]
MSLCRMWAERAGCLDLLEKGADFFCASYGLCADHFHETAYLTNNRKQLSIHALPEIFPEAIGTSKWVIPFKPSS